MSMKIRITAGDWGGNYEVRSGQDAIKAFFRDIDANKIKLCQLSPVGEWRKHGTSDDDSVPFRIAPALFKLGKLSAEDLVQTLLKAGLDFEPVEIMAMVQADSWMVGK